MSSKRTDCSGYRTQTDVISGKVLCQDCKRTVRTSQTGRILPHFEPADCAAFVVRARFPFNGGCSFKAQDGSKYCGKHA